MKIITIIWFYMYCFVTAVLISLIAHDISNRNVIEIRKDILGIVISILCAGYQRSEIKRYKRNEEMMLDELRSLGYEQAIAKARKSSVSLPRALAARKFQCADNEWQAFEWRSVQFVISKSPTSTRANVKTI